LAFVKPFLGIALKLLAVCAFTLMAAGIKSLDNRYPAGELVFFRSAFALIPLLIWLRWQGDLINAVRTQNFKGHLVRSLIGVSAMASGFIALGYLPLPDAIAIGYTTPLITVVLASLILKENVRFYRWGAVLIGFIGVLIMLSPHMEASEIAKGFQSRSAIGALIALLGAVLTAGAIIQVRRLTESEKTGAIVFYFSVLSTLYGLSTIVFGWNMPTGADLLILITIGMIGGMGQIFMTQSFRFADASLIAPFEYTSMIWALLIGWFVFGEMPQQAVMMGAGIVVAAGLFVIWREHRLGLRHAQLAAALSQKPL
jgi:drug/metabolite transporter (DMT)-like permease